MSRKNLIAILLAVTVIGCSKKLTVDDGVAAYEKKDFIEAEKIFSGNQDNPMSMYYLALLYYNGLGVPKNSEAAIEWLERSSRLGNTKAMTWLGKLYLDGNSARNIKRDSIRGMELLHEAAKRGESDAYVSLGNYYKDVSKDFEKAQAYYILAGKNIFAQFHLIDIYEKKNQVKSVFDNINQMLSSTEKNASPLVDSARVRLAEYYYYGYGVRPDAKLAADTLLPLINSNLESPANSAGKSLYAWLLFRGEGIQKDSGRAVMLWLESINSKSGGVQTLPYIGLALAYSTGDGVAKDLEKAKRYFNESAWNLDGGGYWYAKLASEGFLGEGCPGMDRMWILEPKTTGNYRYNLIAKEAFVAVAKCLTMRSNVQNNRTSKNIDIQNANKFFGVAKEIEENPIVVNNDKDITSG